MRAPDVRRAGSIAGTVAGVIGAALLPKCPLCAAAMFTALGATSTAALEVAPFARSAAIAIAVLSVVAFIVLEWRRRARCSTRATTPPIRREWC